MDNYINKDRIKLARQYRGMSIKELAEKIKLSKQAISNYESGKRVPSIKELTSISIALGFPYRYFIEKNEISVNYNTTFFRSYLTAQKKYKEKQIIRLSHIRNFYSVLSNHINYPSLNLPTFDVKPTPTLAAKKLREFWGLGNAPINNLLRTVERNGILVSFFDASNDTDKIDAFTNYLNDIWIIALSKNTNSVSRLNFSIAHELGHILLHKDIMENNTEVDRKKFNKIEDEANDFASAFLLPTEEFIKEVNIYNPLFLLDGFTELKRFRKVSISAMIRKLHKLGIISNLKYTNLYKQISKRGWNKREPLDNPNDIPKTSIFRDSINLLLEKKLSVQELLDEFSNNGISLNPRDIEELLNLDENRLKIEECYDKPVINISDIINNN
ncbi:ImmA/IrrE family metallo-endopeptidase [Brachyspira pilosicoli]|uniref:ImmA/IrrE family metallo-endopeptidase n=1 Tax=Brachyspira pilosicoli TaxID=52584 RepID=A0AAJ6KBH4_BRAPL|nr:ImmA/IrrE family metallo-endopeptidase [Brachyspira pilosicoli]WIH89843.1 ImmA/IrrE family metallo-endopeptidase [Brachyspira pilosicoli]WIH92138.1 ImmA/IrrE family metallo-endopeptidase [Brachyspira pilosicoli]WIH94367.1 ImmA/IrrE family metallo-endopeptidase [Brachyspira pilosicoli]